MRELDQHAFRLVLDDDREERVDACEVLIANSGLIGVQPLRWGPDVGLDDGELDVCVVRARTLVDYLAVFVNVMRAPENRDAHVECHKAAQQIAIHTRSPLPIQADGDLIGETPLHVQLIPAAVAVFVP